MAEMNQIGFDKTYCYPNSTVLINKLNIKDAATLSSAERELSGLSAAKLELKPIHGDFDFEHLKKIHKQLFQEVYSWAGETRIVDIAKGNLFCKTEFIDVYAKDIFKNLEKDDFLMGEDKNKNLCDKLAYYMGELNALHPFREGNGRTQRIFISYIAKVAGFNLDFTKTNATDMLEASKKSFMCDYTGFSQIFKSIIEPIKLGERLKFLSISKKALSLYGKKVPQQSMNKLHEHELER